MKTKPLILALLAGLAASGGAQAALHDRGGGLIYDDVLNVTWLQDANYAKTSGYDADGKMIWAQAVAWAANLSYYDNVRGVYWDDWRLPTLGPVNGTTFQYSPSHNGSTDVGHNITSPNAELAYMYYVNLGLTGYSNPDGSHNPNWGIFGNGTYNGTDFSSFGQNDVGLIDNLQNFVYWSGLEYARYPYSAWNFYTHHGYQGVISKDYDFYAWAVRPGDVAAPIPEPETYALLLAGLGLVGWAARRRRG
ncbi:MAG: DUF1566 domain-containing protein [Thiobacillaceae bacterium]|jgi:hypothetical protein|nr:DUF1566 domain-containing protein [Thiobacillaceae bacterium]